MQGIEASTRKGQLVGTGHNTYKHGGQKMYLRLDRSHLVQQGFHSRWVSLLGDRLMAMTGQIVAIVTIALLIYEVDNETSSIVSKLLLPAVFEERSFGLMHGVRATQLTS